MRAIARAVLIVVPPHRGGNELVHRHRHERPIAREEQCRRLSVGILDDAVLAHEEHGVGHALEQGERFHVEGDVTAHA